MAKAESCLPHWLAYMGGAGFFMTGIGLLVWDVLKHREIWWALGVMVLGIVVVYVSFEGVIRTDSGKIE